MMTQTEARRTLGLAQAPSTLQELDRAFKREHTRLRGFMISPPGGMSKDDILDRIAQTQEAYDTLKKTLTGRQTAGPGTQAPVPLPPQAPSRTHASVAHAKARAAPNTRASPPRGLRIASRLRNAAVQAFHRPIRIARWRLGIGYPICVLLILVLGSIFLGGKVFRPQLVEKTAYIRVMTWPAARVYIDGKQVSEAPMREPIPIKAGSHTVLLVSTSGDMEKMIQLEEGELYEITYQFKDPTEIREE